MKKIVSLILALVLMCTTLFGLTACGGSDGNVDDLNAQIADLTKQINDANSKISALEAEKVLQSAEIVTLEADVKVLEAEKATLEANKATLEAEKALLEEKVADLAAEIARLQALMDGNSNALLEEIHQLEAQIDALESEVATLNSAKTNLESQITNLNAQIITLNAEKATLTARITELEASVASKNTEIATFKSTVSALTTEKNNLIAEKNALVTENSELKDENQALRNCLKNIHTFVDGFCTTCGKGVELSPLYVRDGDYIYFGEYPQTIKADDVTITSTTDSRGYYLGSDGNYYAKVTARPFDMNKGYTFSTGTTITYGSVYYFKVEPIRWRILSEGNGVALILCDSIISNVAYQPDYIQDRTTHEYYTTANNAPEGTYADNYKYSNIRKWLNSTFYETAFSSLESLLILTTEVDNSAKSTNPYGQATYWDNGVNKYACENTNDKIFLLSVEEATNAEYGFASFDTYDTARRMLTSDYSRATGAWMNTSSDYYGMGYCPLRSPHCWDGFVTYVLCDNGYIGNSSLSNKYGNVPALRIVL